VSAAAAPDLPDAFATPPDTFEVIEPPPPPGAAFAPCAAPGATVRARSRLALPAPACPDERRLSEWASAVSLAARIVRARPDVRFLASAPRAHASIERDLAAVLVDLGRAAEPDAGGLASRAVQLAWPWIADGGALPGGIAPPDGALAGILARSSLAHGAFRSAAGSSVRGAAGLAPELGQGVRKRPAPWGLLGARAVHGLEGHLCIVAKTSRGIELVSDVTTSADERERPAAVERLRAIVLRAARRAGELFAFEPIGPALFANVRRAMEAPLRALFHEGALHGETADDAFDVRCGPAAQDDSAVVCEVTLQPAAPIERIRVVLRLREPDPTAALAGGAR
jgi:hypothetical protein